MTLNPAQELIKYGQSVWYDNISRGLLQSGEITRLISEWGVRGITTNPSIFNKAIGSTSLYDEQIIELKAKGLSSEEVFDQLAISDVTAAADILRPIYEESGGVDGFVSIEVSPLLAADTKATIKEALRLCNIINRPNIMIKIPGTPEGLPAIKAVLEEGINVNVTLIFSIENYELVATAYCEALRNRLSKGLAIDKIRSVASLFVSRVDSATDRALELIAKNGKDALADHALALRGRFGIANSKLVYQKFLDLFEGEKFQALKVKGAFPQRPLWASTSTKNPSYRDVIYVEELIGNYTVNTIPHDTLAAFVDHGRVRETLVSEVPLANSLKKELANIGVNLSQIFADLLYDGIGQFKDSFLQLNNTITQKR